jgi:hypothetical protein
MIAVGVAVFAFGIAMLWLFLTRASRAAAVSQSDFDEVYDELAAEGEVDGDRDRDDAWRDFDRWQIAEEEDRLEREEPADE